MKKYIMNMEFKDGRLLLSALFKFIYKFKALLIKISAALFNWWKFESYL